MARSRPEAPLYQALASTLRGEINGGDFGLGDRIPTEPELARRHGVSRNTVRQAVERLVEEGVLDRQQGRGTFVSALPRPDPALFERPPAQTYAFRLIGHGWAPASAALASQFGLAPDGELFRMIRLRLEAGRPAAIKRYFAPADLWRGAPPTPGEIESAPFDAMLIARGVRMMRMNITARPGLLAPEDAALLGAPPGGVALYAERVGFNEHGRAVRLSETVLAEAHARLFWSVRRPYGDQGSGEGLTFSTWTAVALD
jgi:GntR family transcriptional regulator